MTASRQERLANELGVEEATDVTADNIDDDPPTVYDRDRWDGDVTAAKTVYLWWGTHTIETRIQDFADGDSQLFLVDPPSSPPPYAAEWLSDWMSRHELLQSAALILAKDWNIDIEEVSR